VVLWGALLEKTADTAVVHGYSSFALQLPSLPGDVVLPRILRYARVTRFGERVDAIA
jgi:hypothetical protein